MSAYLYELVLLFSRWPITEIKTVTFPPVLVTHTQSRAPFQVAPRAELNDFHAVCCFKTLAARRTHAGGGSITLDGSVTVAVRVRGRWHGQAKKHLGRQDLDDLDGLSVPPCTTFGGSLVFLEFSK